MVLEEHQLVRIKRRNRSGRNRESEGSIVLIEGLTHAYRLVRANRGSAGVDGVSFEAIESAEGETGFIAELQDALKSKRYGLFKVPTTAGWTRAHALR